MLENARGVESVTNCTADFDDFNLWLENNAPGLCRS